MKKILPVIIGLLILSGIHAFTTNAQTGLLVPQWKLESGVLIPRNSSNDQLDIASGTIDALYDGSGNKYVTSSGGGGADGVGVTTSSLGDYADGNIVFVFNSSTISATSSFHINSSTGEITIIHNAGSDDEVAVEIIVNAAGNADIKALFIDYITGAVGPGDDEEGIFINLDQTDATGGHFAGFELFPTEGGLDEIFGLEVGALVGPIDQLSGNFADLTIASTTASGTVTVEFNSATTTVTLFASDNDTVTVGSAATFGEIEFILDTVASGAGVKPTFEFSSSSVFVSFTPADGTNGFKNTGIIVIDEEDIPGWTVDASSNFLIRITRTQNNLTTVPIEKKVQVAAVTRFLWDKDGNLNINHATATTGRFNGDVTVGGNVGIGTASPQELLHVGAGTDSSDITATDLLVTRAGPSNLSVRDSTNDVETFLFASTVGGVMGTVTNDPLNIKTNNTLAIFIDATQNVGIGTSTPASKLHIIGDLRVSTSSTMPTLTVTTIAISGDSITDFAGTHLTVTGGVLDVNTALASGTINVAISKPSSTIHNQLAQAKYDFAYTITSISCSVDAQAATIVMDHRAESTPNTEGAFVLSGQGELDCDTNSASSTSFNDATFSINEILNFNVSTTNATIPGALRIHVKYTIDDI